MQVYGRIRDILVTPEFIFPKINITMLFRYATGLALYLIIGVSNIPKLHLLIKESDEILSKYSKYPSKWSSFKNCLWQEGCEVCYLTTSLSCGARPSVQRETKLSAFLGYCSSFEPFYSMLIQSTSRHVSQPFYVKLFFLKAENDDLSICKPACFTSVLQHDPAQ